MQKMRSWRRGCLDNKTSYEQNGCGTLPRRKCNALFMKTATLPSLRVQPEFREAAESVLREGETLTSLMETAMRETIHKRRAQDEFIARGLRSSEEAKRTGVYYSTSEVVAEMQRRLDARRKQLLG
jgi:hypothetical protein